MGEKQNKNSMLYWWPKVSDLRVPMPTTKWVVIPEPAWKLCEILDGEPNPYPEVIRSLRSIAEAMGCPLFIRGDITSGKHGYPQTCYLDKPEDIPSNVFRLVEEALLGPDEPPLAFFVREHLSLDHAFHGFGGLPIAKERRYFVRDGQVQCHHPYWPEEALRFYRPLKEPPDWRRQLRDLNVENDDEIDCLSAIAEKLSQRLQGYWSVDFAMTSDGKWYFIDAALGDHSWHPKHGKAEQEDREDKRE